MDASMLILLALKGKGLTYGELETLLNDELEDRSPARSRNDFLYELDHLGKGQMIREEGRTFVVTNEGQELIRGSKTVRFITTRMAA